MMGVMAHRHDDLPDHPGLTHTHTHDGVTHTHVHAGATTIPAGPAPRLHLSGIVLPEGERRDLWLVDGRVSFTPVADAATVATGVWIMPGFVDAHCHIGLAAQGPVDADTAEEQAVTDRDAGTLLVRDAGSPSDTRWIDDRDDLPRIIRAGQHIARPKRYIKNFADEVEPEHLIDSVKRQIAKGDGWVKLVGDWIDRDTGDLAPLWTSEQATAAIDTAHEYGARVTAHTFSEDAVTLLVNAGIDGIEHGTGLDDATIATMAERQVALVPTMVNLENFPTYAAAGESKFPRYAAHMRDLHARRFETLGKAVEAGVPVYAGTDAGGTVPHGLIGDEVQLLGRLGGAEFALGAASWRARSWLRNEGLVEGASADLVVFAEDPRIHLGVARHPRLVILRGRVVLG